MTVGVDEVGRGSVAGPVVVAAVGFGANHQKIEGIKDSKKLTKNRREKLEPLIRQQASAVGVGLVAAKEVDEKGIVWSLARAAKLAVLEVRQKTEVTHVVIDGPKTMGLEKLGVEVKPVIDGDEKIYEVAAASIVAKVYRDSLMLKFSRKYPGYGWETNAGYGTKRHIAAIKKIGFTPLHRKTFCGKIFDLRF